MKITEWQKILETQRTSHGKVQYTVTELAHLAGCTRPVLNVALSRLLKQGVLARYAHGIYGLPGSVSADTLLPHLDRHAYITSDFALSEYSLITQNVYRITCFTNRRHNLSKNRRTYPANYQFTTVSPSIYRPPRKGVMAGPEQALLDFLTISRRRGLAPRSMVTFRKLHTLDRAVLEKLLPHYPATVRREHQQLL